MECRNRRRVLRMSASLAASPGKTSNPFTSGRGRTKMNVVPIFRRLWRRRMMLPRFAVTAPSCPTRSGCLCCACRPAVARRHEHECNARDDGSANGRDPASLDFEAAAQQKAVELLRRLPELRLALDWDVEAAFVGDPAAKTRHEIIFCYPGVEAIAVYRI